MSGTRSMVLSVLVGAAVAVAAVKIGSVLNLQNAIMSDPNRKALVQCGANIMELRTCLLQVIAPAQLSRPEYWLLGQPPGVLWALLYALVGLGGGVAAYWLRLAGFGAGGAGRAAASTATPEWVTELARLLASGVAGALMYLILRLPAPVLSSVLSVRVQGAGTQGGGDIFWSLLALGVLAGLFASTFYRRAEVILESIMKGRAHDEPATQAGAPALGNAAAPGSGKV